MTTATRVKSQKSAQSASTGIRLSRTSTITTTKPTVVSIVLRDETDTAIAALLTAPRTRGRKSMLSFAADARLGKHMRSNRDLRKMLLATTEALENANDGLSGPIKNAHVVIAEKSRNLLNTLNA